MACVCLIRVMKGLEDWHCMISGIAIKQKTQKIIKTFLCFNFPAANCYCSIQGLSCATF